MARVKSTSTADPRAHVGTTASWATAELGVLWRRLEFSGAVPTGADLPGALSGDAAVFVSDELAKRGLPTAPGSPQWNDLAALADDPDGFARAVRRLSDQIEMSPQPSGEWTPVIDVLGEEMTARLIGSSVSSVRRYASGSRGTPQPIAERLHFLALVLADLAGSYNEFGMRRWFTRPRTALGGRRPVDLLGSFDPDDAEASAVAELAAALPGLGAT